MTVPSYADPAPASGSAPPFVLVTGGKGGVGKTTVAANLGVALARDGMRPLLVDLDFGLANLDVVLGVEVERTVEDFFDGEVPLERCLSAAPGGARLLAAGSGSYEMGSPDPTRRGRLRDDLARIEADLVVADSPAGIGDDVLDFALGADRVLVVTTPDPAAVTDAYAVIKAIDAYAADRDVEVATPELFVNLATHASEARDVARKLASVCERFLARSPRFAGWMSRSRSVLRAVLDQRPFVLSEEGSTATRGLTRLARHYATTASPAGGSKPASKASIGHGR